MFRVRSSGKDFRVRILGLEVQGQTVSGRALNPVVQIDHPRK
jgi:hypothetical protein